ncbi:hypothetical protein FIBSPDRAFT_927821 [Athelia psychrophila]|uniref:MYND-type domain-containing protein n=1 Tax=Athelia psychrophila TaxID=1759441 RepID=A0A166R2K1_9AGAM|nr:hypothetical protein FIBSPDRAFT_927821 [Fibularhizoctonia sp. CBS 109695]
MRVLTIIPAIIEMMSHSEVLRHKMASTPGVVTMITKYWMAEGSVNLESAFAAAGAPHPFTKTLIILIKPENRPSTCLPEFIAAVPGGAKSAAAHAIMQLNAVVGQPLLPRHFYTVRNHTTLIGNLSFSTTPTLLLELLCQGMIPSTVRTLVWLEKQPTNTPDEAQTACETLDAAIMCSNGPSWVVQALDAGLLPAALKSASRITLQLEKPRSLQYATLLPNFLCQYLVYKSVVRSAAKALRRTARLDVDRSRGGPIWDAWGVFEALARDRIALKESLDEKESKSQKCHRGDCRTVMDPDDLLRCTGCISAIYCDRACQKMDWPLHKLACKKTQQLLRDGIAVPMSPGETRFIGKIVFKDIGENGELMKALLTAHPDKQSSRRSSSEFVFHFDYTRVPSTMRLLLTSDLSGMHAEWDKIVEDCVRSEGEMMVATAEVQRGSMTRTLVYPFPTTMIIKKSLKPGKQVRSRDDPDKLEHWRLDDI